MMISGVKGQKAVQACKIRLLNLGPALFFFYHNRKDPGLQAFFAIPDYEYPNTAKAHTAVAAVFPA